jgi:hypothetical protein
MFWRPWPRSTSISVISKESSCQRQHRGISNDLRRKCSCDQCKLSINRSKAARKTNGRSMICFVCRFRRSVHDMRPHWFLFRTQPSLWPVVCVQLLSPKRFAKHEEEEEQEEWRYICWRTENFTVLKDHRKCPLVHEVKVKWGKESKAIDSGLFWEWRRR